MKAGEGTIHIRTICEAQGGAAGGREENQRAGIWRFGRRVLKGGEIALEHGQEDKSDPPMQPRWGLSVTWNQWPH